MHVIQPRHFVIVEVIFKMKPPEVIQNVSHYSFYCSYEALLEASFPSFLKCLLLSLCLCFETVLQFPLKLHASQ